MERNVVINNKMELALKEYPDNFFDSVVTDPPYGISFMNKHWDYDIPSIDQWKEIMRVLKPGAHILVACGTRTQHRMACAIEDAGFEIRDVITWHYGQGFPKSVNISKELDKKDDKDAAKQWNGWGTALKPATEFWTLARKPISEKTIAENVAVHGTGGINIDGSRIEFKSKDDFDSTTFGRGTNIIGGNYVGATHGDGRTNIEANPSGRFPANVVFDEFTADLLDQQTGVLTSGKMNQHIEGGTFNVYGKQYPRDVETIGDSGGASRFFYCAKPDKAEKDKGLRDQDMKLAGVKSHYGRGFSGGDPYKQVQYRNNHPTVKPVDLMRYLVKLITPPKGTVLDPFAGSGPTAIAAKMELFNYVLIEQDKDSCEIAEGRIRAWNPDLYKPQTLF